MNMNRNEFFLAVGRNDFQAIKEVINGEFDDDYHWAMRTAAERGYLETLKYFVELGADIHNYNDFSLRAASKNGHLETVKYLVEQGAYIHNNNDIAVRLASENGHHAVVEYLVSKGAILPPVEGIH